MRHHRFRRFKFQIRGLFFLRQIISQTTLLFPDSIFNFFLFSFLSLDWINYTRTLSVDYNVVDSIDTQSNFQRLNQRIRCNIHSPKKFEPRGTFLGKNRGKRNGREGRR